MVTAQLLPPVTINTLQVEGLVVILITSTTFWRLLLVAPTFHVNIGVANREFCILSQDLVPANLCVEVLDRCDETRHEPFQT